MVDILRDTEQCARKHYPCQACEWWLETGYDQSDVGADDWLVIQGAQADNWKILPGHQYRKVVYADEGTVRSYRARLDMELLCQKLGII